MNVRALVEQFAAKRIGVFGDLMLDRYIWGEATRISQEAPVPVVAVRTVNARPGGAANVLQNIAGLGATPYAYGVIGDDPNGQQLRKTLAETGANIGGVFADSSRRTTEKTRIIAGNQQVMRIDTEDTEPLDTRLIEPVIVRMEQDAASGRLDAIIVEDYAKGAVTQQALSAIADLGRKHGIPIGLDPHPQNEALVQGLTLITPNRAEAFALAGVHLSRGKTSTAEQLERVAEKLRLQWTPDFLLITLGADGMALYGRDGIPHRVPTRAREVFDVSGAGDTVIASFVLALVSGATPEECCAIANAAAGVVVGKVGTAPVTAPELLDAFAEGT